MNVAKSIARFNPFRSSQGESQAMASNTSTGFTPVNPKPVSSQPFHEDDDDNDGDEERDNSRRTPESQRGNYIRKITKPRAPVAQMRPRNSIYDVSEEDNRPASSLGEKMKIMQQKKSATSTPSANKNLNRNFVPIRDELQPAAVETRDQMPSELHAASQPAAGVVGSNAEVSQMPHSNGDKNVDIEVDEDEGSGDENMSDGEYEVESIISHKFVKGQLLFEVKWKGWSNEDNTLEPEANLNAPDVLSAYLKKIGGRPKPKAGVGRPKKIQASKGVAQLVTRPKTSSVTRPMRRDLTPSDSSEGNQDIPMPDPNEPEPWSTPEIAPGSWDHLVLKVDHFHRESDQCFVGLLWIAEDNRGMRYATREEYWAVKIAAPQALFAYFENNVTFDDTDLVGIPEALVRPPPAQLNMRQSTTQANQQPQKRPVEPSQSSLPERSKKTKR